MKYLVSTEVGLLGIWDAKAFEFVKDRETYLKTFVEDKDIVRTMNENGVIIWGTGGDGRFSIEVRINPQIELTDKERKFISNQDKEYRLEIKSEKAALGSPADETQNFDLENGIYSVKVYHLEYDIDDPKLEALPDYVLVLKKVEKDYKFQPVTSLETL